MGTLIGNAAKRASFETKLFPAGLDLNRCEIHRALGVWKAASAATFRAGQAVMLNGSGEVALFDAANGSTFLGVAKWGKVTLGRSVEVDESVLFETAGATISLKRAGLVASSERVNSLPDGGGTTYTVTTDYTINTTNGTITHVALGSIDETAPVYVSYAWNLTESDYEFEGKNFWQSNDYVTIQDGRIAVIQAPGQIFTTEYDPAVEYSLTGATSNVYANASGLFTSASGSAKLVGKVISVPSAGDPYLGIELIGQVAANS